MTSGLRKAHKYIWLLLVIIVPVILIFSMKNLDIFDEENNNISQIESATKGELKSFENEFVKMAVFKNHVEIILKEALKSSSSIVYEMDKNGMKSTIIGQLTTVGIYNFNTNKQLKGILIYDALKEVEITKFKF